MAYSSVTKMNQLQPTTTQDTTLDRAREPLSDGFLPSSNRRSIQQLVHDQAINRHKSGALHFIDSSTNNQEFYNALTSLSTSAEVKQHLEAVSSVYGQVANYHLGHARMYAFEKTVAECGVTLAKYTSVTPEERRKMEPALLTEIKSVHEAYKLVPDELAHKARALVDKNIGKIAPQGVSGLISDIATQVATGTQPTLPVLGKPVSKDEAETARKILETQRDSAHERAWASNTLAKSLQIHADLCGIACGEKKAPNWDTLKSEMRYINKGYIDPAVRRLVDTELTNLRAGINRKSDDCEKANDSIRRSTKALADDHGYTIPIIP